MADGNFGDAKSVGRGVSKLRIDYGPGYRVYFTRLGETLCVLLCGGDKATQARDIKAASSTRGRAFGGSASPAASWRKD